MMGSDRIFITKHALEQYRDRIINNPTMADEIVRENIRRAFAQSRYISDNKNGILFRNEELMIEFIVRGKKIVTTYKIKKEELLIEIKHERGLKWKLQQI